MKRFRKSDNCSNKLRTERKNKLIFNIIKNSIFTYPYTQSTTSARFLNVYVFFFFLFLQILAYLLWKQLLGRMSCVEILDYVRTWEARLLSWERSRNHKFMVWRQKWHLLSMIAQSLHFWINWLRFFVQ